MQYQFDQVLGMAYSVAEYNLSRFPKCFSTEDDTKNAAKVKEWMDNQRCRAIFSVECKYFCGLQ